MPENKLPEVVKNMEDHLFPGDDKPYRSKRILWIMHQYFRYVLLAAIHGYELGPYRTEFRIKFKLKYIFWEYIPWTHHRKLILSTKAAGYEFRMHMVSTILVKHDYYFNLDGRWKKKLRKLVNTDMVYDLITEK